MSLVRRACSLDRRLSGFGLVCTLLLSLSLASATLSVCQNGRCDVEGDPHRDQHPAQDSELNSASPPSILSSENAVDTTQNGSVEVGRSPSAPSPVLPDVSADGTAHDDSTDESSDTCHSIIERDPRFPLKGHIIELDSEEQIDEIIELAKPPPPFMHLVVMYTPECPFSQHMLKEATALAKRFPEVVFFTLKYDLISGVVSAPYAGVYVFPTTLIFKSGNLIGRIEGYKSFARVAFVLADYSLIWPVVSMEEVEAEQVLEGDYFADDLVLWAAIVGVLFSTGYILALRMGYISAPGAADVANAALAQAPVLAAAAQG